MRSLATVAFVALAVCAPAASAQEVQGNTYTHAGHGVKLKVPDSLKLEESEGALVVFGSEELSIQGSLEVDASNRLPLELLATTIEEGLKASEDLKNVKRLRDVKPQKAMGEWLARELSVETTEGQKAQSFFLFARSAGKLYKLTIIGAESPATTKLIDEIVAGFDLVPPSATAGGGSAGSAPADGGATAGGSSDGGASATGGGTATGGASAAGGSSAAGDATGGGATGTGGGTATAGGGSSGGASGDGAGNPWAAFAEGAFVELTTVSEMGGGQTESVMKTTLVKKTPETLTLKNEGKMVKPAAMDIPASESQIPNGNPSGGSAPAAGSASAGGANMKVLGSGEEEVTIGGKAVKCKWTETEIDMAGQKTTSKVWQSSEVPGGMVKSESSGSFGKSTTTVTAFEAKK